MPQYTAYGLGIDSVLTLPELVTEAHQIDLTIEFGNVFYDFDVGIDKFHYWRTDCETGLHWQELGTFLIRDGKKIIIDPAPDVAEQNLRPALLGACMAVVLHQRGYLILHASAVLIKGKAVTFVGDKGWGKSTMAVTLANRGHQLITDDVMAIDLNSEVPMVFPSFPQLKLCTDALESMGRDPETLPRVMPGASKRQYKLSQEFSTDPVPLETIYLLGIKEELAIAEIASRDRILPLLAHSYGARFGKKLLHLGEGKHFLQCAKLANLVEIYHLTRPVDITLLDRIADLVEKDVDL